MSDPLYFPSSLTDAVAALKERGADGAPMAGATWIMRAPLRHERFDLAYVALSRLDALRQIDIDDREIGIGACVTHSGLAAALAGMPALKALATAAASAANPAVREVATIGGNLCASGFAASDLVPALLCLDAEVELETPAGPERMRLEGFLTVRRTLEPGCLVRRIVVQRTPGRSAHIRLPLRKAGDYPVAIVSAALQLAMDGTVSRVHVAVGSVEAEARRWEHLEKALIGQPLNANFAFRMAEEHAGDFKGRDGVEAPGWYRTKILASLVRRAVTELQAQA
jgi:carbon-monoxide dehydrogenase medium subunit